MRNSSFKPCSFFLKGKMDDIQTSKHDFEKTKKIVLQRIVIRQLFQNLPKQVPIERSIRPGPLSLQKTRHISRDIIYIFKNHIYEIFSAIYGLSCETTGTQQRRFVLLIKSL